MGVTPEPHQQFTLREAQRMRGLSDKALSKLSGISASAIYGIHSGTSPFQTHIGVAELLAEALQMEISDIKWPKGLSNRGRPPLTGTPITVNVTIVNGKICPTCHIALPLCGGPCDNCS